MISSELDLLVECCRSSFDGAAAPRLFELASRAHWPDLLSLARRHRVQGLVSQTVSEFGLPAGNVAQLLQSDASEIAAANLRSVVQSAELLDAFAAAGVPLLFVKGATLAKLAFPNPSMKTSLDIDILVAEDGARAAAAVLRGLGYELLVPRGGSVEEWHLRHKESVWMPAGGLQLDLHTRLADSNALIPTITVDSPRQQVALGRGIGLPTLTFDDLFAYLSVHGAWASWFRLKWLADFAAVVVGCDNDRLTELYRHSVALGAGRAAAQGLLLTERLFGIGRGFALIAALRRSRMNRLLARAALAQMARPGEPTGDAIGTLMIHSTQFFLCPGLRFKVSEFRRQLDDAVDNRRKSRFQ